MEEIIRKALATHKKNYIQCNARIKSAVLMPLFEKGGEYHMLFTQRSNEVGYHKGQVSFPGGTYSEDDSSLLDTALRESWEEIGLKPEDTVIIGELDDIPTTTSIFIISPYVGIIPYPYVFIPNPTEIVDIFEVPLSVLADDRNLRQEYEISNGKPMPVYFYHYKDRIIWGATARIVKQFMDIVRSNSTI